MEGLSFKEGIIQYYYFQKIILNYFNKRRCETDEHTITMGYIVDPEFIISWKKIIQYDKIKGILDNSNINKKSEQNVDSFIEQFITEEKRKEISNIISNNNINISNLNIFDKRNLINLMPIMVFKSQGINEKIAKIKMNFILKKQMLILASQDDYIIKIIIPHVSYFMKYKNIVRLSWEFNYSEEYYSKLNFLENEDSKGIMNYLKNEGIFANHQITKEGPIHFLFNENIEYNIKIKKLHEINLELAKKINYKGLDKTLSSSMNSILQCLVNIKPITDNLLGLDDINGISKYYETVYKNATLCPLTLQYYQILFGLFCNDSNTISYSPKLFKTEIEKMNPLFQDVHSNYTKEFISFLLEVMNKELNGLFNKNSNINSCQNGYLKTIDKSNQIEVLNECKKDFRMTHCSIIGDNLCGFLKNTFTCENCSNVSYNFNFFNMLVFDLEIIAKHLNLNYNNIINLISLDQCFKYFMKEEIIPNIYCPNCKLESKLKYKENIYLMPNYLIIILDQEKTNFKFKVDIPLILDSSNYEEVVKNKKYELIGIVSYNEEKNLPHYIAYCKHNMDNKWRLFNDDIVKECGNDFLQIGTPQILFYKYMNVFNYNDIALNINNSQNNNNNLSLNNLQQNMIFNNQNMNFNNNNFQGASYNFQGNFGVNNQYMGQNINLNNNILNNQFTMQNMFNINNNC